jgi:hypothetical protein
MEYLFHTASTQNNQSIDADPKSIRAEQEIAVNSNAKSVALAFFFLASTSLNGHTDVLIAKARIAEFHIPSGPGVLAPLDDKGNAELDFVTKKKGTVVIIYNAECAATGDAGEWVGLEIYVDNKLANPKETGVDFAFCSATGGTEISTAISRRAFVKLDEGTHTVRVLVSRQGVDSGRLDDTSIVIKD